MTWKLHSGFQVLPGIFLPVQTTTFLSGKKSLGATGKFSLAKIFLGIISLAKIFRPEYCDPECFRCYTGQLLPIEVASVHTGIKSLLLKFTDNLLLVLSRVV